jgi:hypothetical protein
LSEDDDKAARRALLAGPASNDLGCARQIRHRGQIYQSAAWGVQTMEHRWGERHAFDQMVLLRAAGWRVPARVKNMSISGAYLHCTIPDASVVRVRVDFRRQPRAPQVIAYVVRRTVEGIGVEWGEFGCQAVTRLLSRVAPHAVEALPASAGCSRVPRIDRVSRPRRPHAI